MQARRSDDPSRHSIGSQHGDRQGLIHAYDEEEAHGFGLTDLAEDSESDSERRPNGGANGNKRYENIEMENRKSTER
jgi:hypothetical protein